MDEHGKKIKAGQLLSQYLRQIAEEETELVKDPDTGEHRMARKAEALARKMWDIALGFEEQEEVFKDGKPTGERRTVKHSPNRAMMELVYTRIEGRAPTAIHEGDEKITAADRVTEEGKKRIGKIGGIGAGAGS